MKTYTIRHDPVRERKGLKSWAVFEVTHTHDPELFTEVLIGLSGHYTEQEALDAKAALEKEQGQ